MKCDGKTAAGFAIAGIAVGAALIALWQMKQLKERRLLRLVTDKLEPADEPINDRVPAQNAWVHSE